MYYDRARWYNPATGKFLTRDPLGFAGGQVNFYAYCGNDPLVYTDPTGLWVWPWDPNASWSPSDTAGLWFGEGHPVQVGTEWLTGTGPSTRNFGNGDIFTEMLRQHSNVQEARESMRDAIRRRVGGGDTSDFDELHDYKLGGLEGVPKYFGDYSTLLTGGLTGNLAVTYLGSHGMNVKASNIDVSSGTAKLTFIVDNNSSLQSALRPPVIGYQDWWAQGPGHLIDSVTPKSGPLSDVKQHFVWTEVVQFGEPSGELRNGWTPPERLSQDDDCCR